MSCVSQTFKPAVLSVAIAAGCSSASSFAAQWDKQAFLAASAYVTDNFCLSPRDQESEVVGTVTPGGSLRAQGARSNVALSGRVEFNSIQNSDIECVPGGGPGNLLNNRESVIPSGTFFADYDAIDNWLVLEADAFAGLNPINPFGAGINDGINGRQNTNITYRWGVGARVNRQFEQKVGLQLRYNYNEQYNSQNALFGDSSEDRVSASLAMLPGTSRLRLALEGRYSEVSFEETDFNPAFTNTLASAQAVATFDISRSWQVNATAGEEFNEFLSVSDEIDGTYWDVGVRWSPVSRVVVAVGTGERFFGDTPRASISYGHKRSNFNLSYERTLTFPRNLRAPNAGSPDDVIPTDPGLLPGDPVPGTDNPVLIGDSPILVEAFTASYSFNARRTRFNLTARDSQQTRAVDLATGDFRSASASVTRGLPNRVNLSLRLDWRESSGAGGFVGDFSQDVESTSATLVLSRPIARNTSLSLSYRYSEQTSTFATNEFEENRITIGLQHNFR